MSNEEFLKRLEAALVGQVPQEEIDDALRYHREYFAEAGENAANEIPAPEEVAAQIIRERSEYLRRRQVKWARPAVIAALCVGLALTLGVAGGRMLLRNWIGFGRADRSQAVVEAVDQVTFTNDGEAVYLEEGTGHGFHHHQEGDLVYGELEPGTAFESIVIEGVSDNVTIIPSDSFTVELFYDQRERMDCRVKDDVLHITGKFDGVLSTGFQAGAINITVPFDKTLCRIDVETDLGDIYLESVSAGEAELDTGMGDILVSDGVFDLLACDSDLGDVSVSAVKTNTLKCECDAGNLDAVEFDAVETELVADLGNVTAIAQGASEDYDLELEVDLGELRLNGEKKSNSYSQTVHADRLLHAKVDVGNLTLDFTQQ